MTPDEFRLMVVGMLNRIYIPLTSDDLALCLHAIHGSDVDTSPIATLLERDHLDYINRVERSTFFCPALTFPSGAADDEFFTLSHWPIRARLVEDVLSTGQEMLLLKHLCDLAMQVEGAPEGDSASAAALRERIDDLTMNFSRVDIDARRALLAPGESVLPVYRDLAEDHCSDFVRDERFKQRFVVEKIENLDEMQRFFGISAAG